MEKFFGITSGLLVFISFIPYIKNVWQGNITPNLTTWIIWSFIGFVLLVTYKSIGSEESIYPVIFGFVNPVLVTLVMFFVAKKINRITLLEIICILFSVLAIILWYLASNNSNYFIYANYIAIIADLFAVIPTLKDYWKNPENDRPFSWILFSFAYFLLIFSIKNEQEISSYVLPVYMSFMSLLVAIPLVIFCVKNKTKLKDWI